MINERLFLVLSFIFLTLGITYWWNVEVYKAGTERVKLVGHE